MERLTDAEIVREAMTCPSKESAVWQAVQLTRERHDADNAMLREALEEIASDAESDQHFYDRNGPQWTTPAGNEVQDVSASLNKTNALAAIARAALGAS